MPEHTDTRVVTILLVVIGAFVIFPMIFADFGMMGSGRMMGGMWGDGTTSGWVVVVSIVMRLLFFAALLGGGYLVFQAVAGDDRDSERALEALRLAYARGELTDDEYEQRREALERNTESV